MSLVLTCPHNDAGQLRPVRPGRQAALPADPRPGQDHPVPHRARASFTSRYPHAGPLLTRRLNTELITAHWDDLLRVAASVKYGHATAALVVGKLCSSKRQQNALTAAIKEYGALRRTIFAARYLVDETTGGASPASSTRARTCTRCAASWPTPAKGRCGGAATSSRPSRCGA